MDQREILRSTQRIIFLMGSARSGTSWVGNAIQTSPSVLYFHEPYARRCMKASKISEYDAETKDNLRKQFVDDLPVGDPEIFRPPFFGKPFQLFPSPIRKASWFAAKTSTKLKSIFEWANMMVASPEAILLKDHIPLYATELANRLGVELVIIFRNPSQVVASRLRGADLGVMQQVNAFQKERYYKFFESELQELNFDIERLHACTSAEFYSLQWIVESSVYLDVVSSNPKTRMVLYNEFVMDPHTSFRNLLRELDLEENALLSHFLTEGKKDLSSLARFFRDGSRSYFSVYGRKPSERTQEPASKIRQTVDRMLERYGSPAVLNLVQALDDHAPLICI